jgi:hypothetical protein
MVDLTSQGKIDTVFGSSGKVVPSYATSFSALAVSLSGTFVAAGGTGFATGRYFDRGLATVYITSFDTTASEAGQDPASFEIVQQETRNLDTDVFFTPSGTASPPGSFPASSVDYTGISSSPLSQLVDITPGQNYGIAYITPKDDATPEADETVIITLRPDPGKYDIISPSSVTMTILDNDGQRVSGTVYKDTNGNGVKDSGETGLAGVGLFLDANHNGVYDPNTTERIATTDASGNYTLTAVPVGSYTLQQFLPVGYTQSSPANGGGFPITMTTGALITGKVFGDKPVTADPSTLTLQAETATLAGGTVSSTANAGYTGTGYDDYGGNGSSVQWATTRIAASAVTLVFRYANGGTTNRPLSVVVNGVTVGTVACAPTGSWATWSTVSINANLVVGGNTIKATASSSAGGANVDSLTINTGASPSTLQAESASFAGGTVASHSNAGYTGSGYADFGGTNSSATFTVNRTAAGSATLNFRYANGSASNRPLSVSINGIAVGSVTFAPTGSWTSWTTVSLAVNLLSGNNMIKLTVTGSDGPNLDWVSVG